MRNFQSPQLPDDGPVRVGVSAEQQENTIEPWVIENLSRMPLWLRLNSGTLVYLAPLACSVPIDDHELALNAELERLAQQHLVRRNHALPAADPAAAAGPDRHPAGRASARRKASPRDLTAR